LLATLAAAVTLIAVPAVQAFYVKGQQVPTNNEAKFKMTGGLNGKWKVTKFRVLHEAPVFKAKGEERFNGCVDIARDGCGSGDPAGTLTFRFRYWARFTDEGLVELGTCAHRIVAATDGLTGTTGFLMMVDTPKGASFKTHYEGDVNVPGITDSKATLPATC
jgi:hypothetical protein